MNQLWALMVDLQSSRPKAGLTINILVILP